MSYETIISETRGRVGLITMNRPDRLNAMNPQMDYEIRRQIALWNEDDSVGAVVWTGAGRGFCAGADIGRFEARRDGQTADEVVPSANDSWHDMVKASKPIVAAINGVAIGEGLTRTLPCDVRIASESARLSFRFVRVGVTPEFASTHYAPNLIGLGRTLEYMLRANLIPAPEALERRASQLRPRGRRDAGQGRRTRSSEIAANPTWQLAQVKKLVHQNYLERDANKALTDEGVIFRKAQATDAHKEALAAFRERREPRFHGG